MVDPYKSWQDASVARAMGALAMKDLGKPDWKTHPPFKYFLRAMYHVSGKSLLDIGCGVGHYSEVLARSFPKIRYTGVDFSLAMIEEAGRLWSGRNFQVGDATAFDCGPYDVVLASSLVEVMDDWLAGVEGICRTARGQVLLHRVRIHGGPTIRNDTTGYPDQPTYTWVHNEQELQDVFSARGFDLIWFEHWQEYPQATYIFERV